MSFDTVILMFLAYVYLFIVFIKRFAGPNIIIALALVIIDANRT